MIYVWYKLCICDVLEGIWLSFVRVWVYNIFDDVIVYVFIEEEYDKRFENVVRVLSSKGLMLNCEKC